MMTTHAESIDRLIASQGPLAVELGTLWRRLQFTGAVPDGATLSDSLTGVAARRVARALAERGLPVAAGAAGWADLLHLVDDAPAFRAAIERLNDQIEMSPQPGGEWGPVLAALGEELVASLIATSPSSIRRYAAGTRATPQLIAERLHFLALVLADLAGSYNDFGMRRWFSRPRTALGGRRPQELLGEFDPDGPDASAVSSLAAALPGLGAA